MKKRSCLTSIKQKYDSLTPVEKKIADYIVAESQSVISMPVAEFAENAGGLRALPVTAVINLLRTSPTRTELMLAMPYSMVSSWI